MIFSVRHICWARLPPTQRVPGPADRAGPHRPQLHQPLQQQAALGAASCAPRLAQASPGQGRHRRPAGGRAGGGGGGGEVGRGL